MAWHLDSKQNKCVYGGIYFIGKILKHFEN